MSNAATQRHIPMTPEEREAAFAEIHRAQEEYERDLEQINQRNRTGLLVYVASAVGLAALGLFLAGRGLSLYWSGLAVAFGAGAISGVAASAFGERLSSPRREK